ncbi:MAG: PEP-CTERM sorting domain-containing protein [Acidiferrobacteraceae bacterium]
MEINLRKLLYGGCVGLLLSGTAQAASVTYALNENNAGLPAMSYGTVQLSDITGGGVTFTVTPENLTAGGNFGIQNFGFNSDLTLNSSNYTLPTGWTFGTNSNLDGYGSFDDITSGNGTNRQSSLTFSVNVGNIKDYQLANSNGNYFAAHIAGFNNINNKGSVVTSAYFASDVTPVPEANTWAMMSVGLAALGLRLRRRRV